MQMAEMRAESKRANVGRTFLSVPGVCTDRNVLPAGVRSSAIRLIGVTESNRLRQFFASDVTRGEKRRPPESGLSGERDEIRPPLFAVASRNRRYPQCRRRAASASGCSTALRPRLPTFYTDRRHLHCKEPEVATRGCRQLG